MNEITNVEKEAVEIQQENDSLLTKINRLKITDDKTFKTGLDYSKQLKVIAKDIDGKEKEFTRPLLDTIEKIRNVFRPGKEAVKKMLRILEDEKILPYNRELEKTKREEAEKIRQIELEKMRIDREEALKKALAEKEITKAEAKKEEKAIAEEMKIEEQKEIKIETQVKTKTGSTSFRKTWTFEIVDTGIVPRSYCEPSKSLIDNAIKNGVRDIIGVRIFEKETVVSR